MKNKMKNKRKRKEEKSSRMKNKRLQWNEVTQLAITIWQKMRSGQLRRASQMNKWSNKWHPDKK